MEAAAADPCFLYWKRIPKGKRSIIITSELPEIAVLQVDGSLGIEEGKFLADEAKEVGRFLSKPRTILKPVLSRRLNDIDIWRFPSADCTISQSDKLAYHSTS